MAHPGTILSLAIQINHTLFSVLDSYTPTFIRIDFHYALSEVWKALEPCLPAPPVQFCVLGQGIGCGIPFTRRPFTAAFSELGDRLVSHLFDVARSLGATFADLTFLRFDCYHLASEVWKALKPCLPPPPVRYCVLGHGIGCGILPARRPFTDAFSELGARLVSHLIDNVWSLGCSLTAAVPIPIFLRFDFFHLASDVWRALEPCVPSPPVQYCVLGAGIGCGTPIARRPLTDALSELGTRLAVHLVASARPLVLSLVDGMSIMLSHHLPWKSLLYSVLYLFAFLTVSSLWMLYSLDWTLDEHGLQPLSSINARLGLAYNKLCRLSIRPRTFTIYAICMSLLLYIFWPTRALRVHCYESLLYDAAGGDRFYCSRSPTTYAFEQLVRMALDSRLLQVALVAIKVLSAVSFAVYCVLVDFSVWVRLRSLILLL